MALFRFCIGLHWDCWLYSVDRLGRLGDERKWLGYWNAYLRESPLSPASSCGKAVSNHFVLYCSTSQTLVACIWRSLEESQCTTKLVDESTKQARLRALIRAATPDLFVVPTLPWLVPGLHLRFMVARLPIPNYSVQA
ncbi:hypothetical protein VTI28DRAFT_6950 [Corynascus sepedonium]